MVNFLLWKSAENVNGHHMHTYLYCRDTVGVGMGYHVLPHVVVAVSSRSCRTELHGQLVTVCSGLTMSWYLVTAKREREKVEEKLSIRLEVPIAESEYHIMV